MRGQILLSGGPDGLDVAVTDRISTAAQRRVKDNVKKGSHPGRGHKEQRPSLREGSPVSWALTNYSRG